jgi:predicted MPP superfamily phosphohydrolase
MPAKLSLRVRPLDALAAALDVVGHAAAGTFLTNRVVIGAPEYWPKALLILGHWGAWPLLGLLNAWLAGRRGGLARAMLWPSTPGRLWALFFAALGARWLAQEAARKRHPRTLPATVRALGTEAHDLREHVFRYEGLSGSGVRGALRRANEIYRLEVRSYEVALDCLPPQFDGFTLVQISDVHYGQFSSAEFVRSYVDMVVGWSSDFIALTGDYQTYPRDVESVARLLAPLGQWSRRERGGRGVAAVLGNHDHEAGAEHVADALRRAGIPVLNNEHMRIERGGASLYVAGVADPWSPWHNLDLALLGIPEGACTVLLAHVPDYLDMASAGRVALQLSGHNHGGQIKVPGLGALLVSSRYGRRYDEGFFAHGGTLMYVSRGLGGKPPVRFGSLPEVTRFVLRSA